MYPSRIYRRKIQPIVGETSAASELPPHRDARYPPSTSGSLIIAQEIWIDLALGMRLAGVQTFGLILRSPSLRALGRDKHPTDLPSPTAMAGQKRDVEARRCTGGNRHATYQRTIWEMGMYRRTTINIFNVAKAVSSQRCVPARDGNNNASSLRTMVRMSNLVAAVSARRAPIDQHESARCRDSNHSS
jgi:hypothetical protein